MTGRLVGELDSPSINTVTSDPHRRETTANGARSRDRTVIVSVAIGTLLAVVVIVVTVMGLRGYRIYVMQTPSMGTAAPVGSLVVTQPTEVEQLQLGDVVTVAPQGGGITRTHRVIELSDGSATTKGDLNGTPDSEAVDGENLVGRAMLIIPALGWVVKMLPIVMVTVLVAFLLTHWMRDPQARFRNRVLGVFCGMALACVLVQPLLGVQLLSMDVNHDPDEPSAKAYVVSTGLLPVRVAPLEDGGQESAVLAPTGTAGTAVATQPSANGQLAFYPQMSLTPAWWVGLALYCALPFAVFGLHEVLTRRKAKLA